VLNSFERGKKYLNQEIHLLQLFHLPLTWHWNITLKNILVAFPVLFPLGLQTGVARPRGNYSPAEQFFKGDFFRQEKGMSDTVAE
jgi:hypothetical protein